MFGIGVGVEVIEKRPMKKWLVRIGDWGVNSAIVTV